MGFEAGAALMRGVLGVGAVLLVAYAMSADRRRIAWRTVIGGVVLHVALGLLLLRVPPARAAIFALNGVAVALQDATDAGTGFVFGYLGGAAPPFDVARPGAAFILAFKALPLVLTISALAALLFHWGLLQRVVAVFAWVLRRALGLDGALALGAAVHVFVGMIEAPLLIRPWLAAMPRGALFALMTCGMAGVAGTVMVIYAGVLAPVVPDALGNILVASVMSTPAALAIAALMIPFAPEGDAAELTPATEAAGAVDALVRGAMAGVQPLVGITVLLLVTVALVALVNGVLGAVFGAGVTLQGLVAVPLRPAMWLIGIGWNETALAANLMATKTVLNEFVAYLDLARAAPDALTPRDRLVMTYALCGFANFGSLGILTGGLGVMLPGRRGEIASLGLLSLVAGSLATLSSGALAGLLVD